MAKEAIIEGVPCGVEQVPGGVSREGDNGLG